MPTNTKKTKKAKIMRAFRLPPALMEAIKAECKDRDISISEFIRQAATQHLQTTT
jgi:hypothetical protein